ncbi:aconitase family protein, partial [Cronobacter sakazakii]|uniref:aconitase family protein n=1 Tax=Cronobacter sakazakii TaxID=28141 RepID=UPI001F338636
MKTGAIAIAAITSCTNTSNPYVFYTADSKDPIYTDLVEIDLNTIESNLSGPKRPQDLIPLSDMKDAFHKAVVAPVGTQGLGFNEQEFDKEVKVTLEDKEVTMKTGAIAIAAITSCTNTSNPYV